MKYYSDDLYIKVDGNYSLNSSLLEVNSQNFTILNDELTINISGNIEFRAEDIILMSDNSNYLEFGVKGAVVNAFLNSIKIENDLFTFSGNINSSLFLFENLSDDSASSILKLDFKNISSPEYNNLWITFCADGEIKGGIRGAVIDGDDIYPAFKSVDVDERAANTDSGKLSTAAGFAQYTTGGSDFGEWMEIGDLTEWSYKIIDGILKIPEGTVVYIYDNKIWKDKINGTAMIITARAALLGNLKSSDKIGAVVSFVGQVPVIITGTASDGDYLIPFKNNCFAVSKYSITFEQYKAVIGTAWGKELYRGETKLINCAIGIK